MGQQNDIFFFLSRSAFLRIERNKAGFDIFFDYYDNWSSQEQNSAYICLAGHDLK